MKIEEALKRPLLWLPCRHHVGELLVGGAFTAIFGDIDKSPYYQKFKDFKKSWPGIDKTKYEPLQILPWMQGKVAEVVEFYESALKAENSPRKDYKESLELALVVLGHPPENFSFKLPGAVSKPRWMAKILYGYKIFLFRKALKLPKKEQAKFERFAVFCSLFYVKHWFTLPLASDAPFNDLDFYKSMLIFDDYDSEVAQAVLEKICRHTWYMNQEFSPLNLFSEKVNDKTKSKIALKLSKIKSPKSYGLGQPSVVPIGTDRDGLEYCVSDFVGDGSLFIFDNLKFGKDWLQKPISSWKNNPSYLEMERFVKTLLVCNDPAERAVKLMSDYSNILTKNSKERQDILQLVEAHRKEQSDTNKSTLFSSFSV